MGEDPTPAPPPTSAPTWKNGVDFVNPLSESRCKSKGRTSGSWGDLGTKISEAECLAKCAAKKSCKYVSYKDHGNQQCTSFTSCEAQSKSGHKTYTKTTA